MPDDRNKILGRMLERLHASLTTGPILNCRPHSSRQRVDLVQLAGLDGTAAGAILARLLGTEGEVVVRAPADAPAGGTGGTGDLAGDRHEGSERQQSFLAKLRTIAEDARTYEQDTGVHALYVGYPILNVPSESGRAGRYGTAKRILAPVAFVPVRMTVRTTRQRSVTLACAGEGAERVVPNSALLAWIEQVTGKQLPLLFADDDGTQPWRELHELAGHLAALLELAPPADIHAEAELRSVPLADAEELRRPGVIPSAVLGLFPVMNQALLRDIEALADGEKTEGPIESFLKAGIGLGERAETAAVRKGGRDVASERFVAFADPCQARAVRLARTSRGLVVHGPPGTGKSQTIVNVIGDHLARGERVLFVCDKRTALDVVHHRLARLGVADLCAIVHDAQRDRRELYKRIREQLDALADARTNPAAVAELAQVDAELARIHRELTDHARAVGERPDGGAGKSLHELVGEWLGVEVPAALDVGRTIPDVRLGELVPLEREVREVLDRGLKEQFPTNPWSSALGIELGRWLERPVEEWRRSLASVHDAARAADATIAAEVPDFARDVDVRSQGDARAALAESLAPLVKHGDEAMFADWATAEPVRVAKAMGAVDVLEPHLRRLEQAPPDPELAIVLRSQPPGIGDLVLWIGKIAAYLAIATKWYRFFFFRRKRGAMQVLQRFGLPLGTAAAERVSGVLSTARARELARDCVQQLLPHVALSELTDAHLVESVRRVRELLDALRRLETEGALRSLASRVRADLAAAGTRRTLLDGLRRSKPRADAIVALEESLLAAGLFSAALREDFGSQLRGGHALIATVTLLEQRFGSVEGILRLRRALSSLPPTVADAVVQLAERGASADDGWSVVRRGVLAAEIEARVHASPLLQDVDGDRLHAAHQRYRSLEERKRALVRDGIVDAWTQKQRQRLLASTGSRLNGAGAELRRRFVSRGERALRLRQVIAAGAATEGGDPLFDLRPVWMASPETVAQIFPRAPLFDVVIFDEASQCRLEEALPVLTRARRVVVAGDPKQLPPTRFFESNVAQSHDDDSDGTEQGLFEEQQAQAEDLLSAALNLEIEQAYLDVHYRSQNADLIEFSNRSFYDARLQPIPGHPKNRAVVPPLRLLRVHGVYEERANALEAREVVRIVRELLARPQPPSIGIGCFNLVQRDLIVEALDEAGAADAEFGARLAAARTRQGSASFEGLFVKNLENVQGDERDHMIISTTYGPDPKNRFYQRFGPLASAGGGRRLNVLVTRARQAVHLVTSIPPEVYRSLPPLEPGRLPNGAWLLFSYLQYAERLEKLYADAIAERVRARALAEPAVVVRPTSAPSALATAIARRLMGAQRIGSEVFWGNEGFCVDAALAHPTRDGDVTVGVLCDRARYEKAADTVEWDLFRTQILEGQGWTFVRAWAPEIFRDPEATVERIGRAVSEFLAAEAPPQPRPPASATPWN